MVSSNGERIGRELAKRVVNGNGAPRAGTLGRARLAREMFAGRYRPSQSLDLRAVAAEYELDLEVVVKTFAEFQLLGMVTISGRFSAVVQSPKPK